MADDDFTTEQGTDYNDKVHRLVAQVAQMFGGQVPAGAFGGSPQGSPGIQQMPGGGTPMGRPPVPGMNPAVPPQPGQMTQQLPSMAQLPAQAQMPWQQPGQPLPGGQPPVNPNPGQPFAAYRIGDQPWMTQPITGRGGTSMSSAPVPSDQYAQQAQQKPQQVSMDPSAVDTFGSKPTEPPQALPRPTMQDAQKWIMKMRPGANTAQIQQDTPKALDYLTKQWRLDQKTAQDEFKDRMAIAREQRLQQSSEARMQHAQQQLDFWQKKLDTATSQKDRDYALKQADEWTKMYKTILSGQISAGFMPAGADKDFVESQLKGALAAEGPAPGGGDSKKKAPSEEPSDDDMPEADTPEEAAKLPKGTKFRAADGKIRIVP